MTRSHSERPEIVLDLSRLLSRIRHKTPTGVDRVEMAYARELLRQTPDRLSFGAVHPIGVYGRIPKSAALSFLNATESAWDSRNPISSNAMKLAMKKLEVLFALRPCVVPKASRPRVLIQSSPHHLHNEKMVRSIIKREEAKFLCLLHDLIPIEYPEYARPTGKDIHLNRMNTVARLADGVVANSESTKRSFLHLIDTERKIEVCVAHLGLTRYKKPVRRSTGGRPYFVVLGTIEPRKNHLLLLNIWRNLSLKHGSLEVPKLIILGRRGWENEQIVDMLERCPALLGCVEEYSGMADSEVRDLIAGAQALLLPSFAEGFGMPVPEALALGVPVICSDIASLREAGDDIPLYLDPLDGVGWQNAILSFGAPRSAARERQVKQLSTWHGPTWEDHIKKVMKVAHSLAPDS